MANFSILYVAIILIGYALPVVKYVRKKKHWLETASLIFMAVYTVVLIQTTIFPFYFDKTIFESQPPRINLIPFHTIYETCTHLSAGTALRQVAGNVILFMPLGFLLPIFCSKAQRNFPALLYIIGVSLGIEIVQLLISLLTGIPNRVADIDDIILNTLGGEIGYLIYRFCRRYIFPLFIRQPEKS